MYDVERYSWTDVPAMKEGRYSHSSLALGRMIYVFFSSQDQAKLSFERFDAQSYLNGKVVAW